MGRGREIAFVAILLRTAGYFGYLGKDYFDNKDIERASHDEISGYGYSIKPSDLGDDIVTVEGKNNTPFESTSTGLAKGFIRLANKCGPINRHESPKGTTSNLIYARVPDASKCFPR